MPDRTPEQDAERASHARQLLDNALFVESFDAVRRKIMDEWLAAPARDAEGREQLWLMVKLLDRVRDHIKGVAETGKVATIRLAEAERHRAPARFQARIGEVYDAAV